jgi:hypothetical protein
VWSVKTIVTRSKVIKPMATLHDHQTRARAAHTGFVPQPESPEMPEKLALHQEQPLEADPLLNHDFILGILTGALLMSSSLGLVFGGKP